METEFQEVGKVTCLVSSVGVPYIIISVDKYLYLFPSSRTFVDPNTKRKHKSDFPQHIKNESTETTIFGEVRMTVLGHYRGSTNCLDVVRGIV